MVSVVEDGFVQGVMGRKDAVKQSGGKDFRE
jgi:hypothetical protein